jgi:phosphatidate cytidylyltransferase
MIYIGMPMGMLAAVHERFGARATLLVIATVVVSDTFQYYAGRMFGRRPLAPSISPKKTIEGAIGGLVAGTAFMVFGGSFVFPEHSRSSLAILGLVMVVAGIVGDLFESRLKREANVKDSSALIPGHGGMLDRIDALLFVTPVFFIYVLG